MVYISSLILIVSAVLLQMLGLLSEAQMTLVVTVMVVTCLVMPKKHCLLVVSMSYLTTALLEMYLVYNTKRLGTYDSNASLSIVCIGITAYAYITEFLLIAEVLISLAVNADGETDVNLSLTKSNFMSNVQMLNLNAAFMSLEVTLLAIYYKARVGINFMPFALTFLAFQVAAGALIQFSCNKMIASEIAKRKKKAENNPIKEGDAVIYETGRKQQEDCGKSEEGSTTN